MTNNQNWKIYNSHNTSKWIKLNNIFNPLISMLLNLQMSLYFFFNPEIILKEF